MRVVITGASGFLGRHLLKKAPKGAEIMACFHRTAIDVLFNGVPLPLNLTNPDWSAIRDFAPDVIIHLAAMARLDDCENNPDLAHQINVTATSTLADLANELNARLIFTSTDLIYDGRNGNYDENDPPNPLNVYAKTKRAAEQYLLEHCHNAVSVRCALIYGTALGGQPTFTEAMIRKLRDGQPVRLFTDELRNPVWVANLAEMLWELTDADYTGPLNIGGPEALSRLEMGRIICQTLTLSEANLVGIRAADLQLKVPRPADCSLSLTRLQKVLKSPQIPFSEAIRQDFL